MFVLILIFFTFTSVPGLVAVNIKNWEVNARQAEAYDAAGEYDKARMMYERLQEVSLEPWQEGRLLYNLGTLDLKEGRYRAALEKLKKVRNLEGFDEYRERNVKLAEIGLKKERSNNQEKPDQKNKEEQEQENKENKFENSAETIEVLRLVQEMESLDRKKAIQKQESEINGKRIKVEEEGGKRPW